MKAVCGEYSLYRSSVVEWSKIFLERLELLEDDARPGQAHRVITPEMIAEVNALVLDNRRIIVDEIRLLPGNHQMARIVRHKYESVREGYIRNGGKEVNFFTSALKAFQCDNRIVMAQMKHLDDFLRGRIIERMECRRTQLQVSEELGIVQTVISRLWQRFQDDGNVSRCYSAGRTRVATPNEDRYIWQLLPKETDGAQHQTCLVSSLQLPFRGSMGAEFLFMDHNVRPQRANIVDECLQSVDITRMDWPAYSPDLNPIEHVWDILGRRIAAR
ncbi:uncharacterized protein TNCV_331981 [Trichonephila clavipes]|nr:uncharacterized protein TNCV_331981 [Trichonephila clavipes]